MSPKAGDTAFLHTYGSFTGHTPYILQNDLTKSDNQPNEVERQT